MRVFQQPKQVAGAGFSAPYSGGSFRAEFFVALALVIAAAVVSLATSVTGGELLGMFPG